MTVYLDLLFLLDFFGDFLCLWISSALYVKVPLWRRILGAAVGGIYGVFSCLYPFLKIGLIKLFVPFIISAIAFFPNRLPHFLKSAAIYIISSMLLSGGVMLFLENKSLSRLLLALLGVSCILVSAISVFKNKIYAKYLPLEIRLDGKTVRAQGFYDSGNRLMMQDGLYKVIVADLSLIKKLISPIVNYENLSEFIGAERIYTVNCSSVEYATLIAFKPDRILVNGVIYDDVLVAVSKTPISEEVILHSVMV